MTIACRYLAEMVQGRQTLMYYTILAGTNFWHFGSNFLLHITHIEAVDSATDLVGYSSQLSIVGILIESIAEQGDEQRCHTAGSRALVDLWAGGGGGGGGGRGADRSRKERRRST